MKTLFKLLLVLFTISLFTSCCTEVRKPEYKTYRAKVVNSDIITNVTVFKESILNPGDTVVVMWNVEEQYNEVKFELDFVPMSIYDKYNKVVIQ